MSTPVIHDPTTLPSDDNVNPYTFCVELKGSQWFLQKGVRIQPPTTLPPALSPANSPVGGAS